MHREQSSNPAVSAPGPLNWQLYPIERYGDFAAAWDRLNDAATGLPFMRSLFIRNLIAVFATGDERLAVLGAAGDERALGIVKNVGRATWQTWQPSQLPLGAWVMSPGLRHADVLPALQRRLPGMPLLFAATQQDPLVYERPPDTALLRTVDYIETGWINVQGSFDDYWRSRSKQLQQNMRTQHSRLTRENTPGLLETIVDAESVAGAVADFGRFESAGWKGAAGSAVSADNEQGRFYRAMLEDFCRAGAARIYRYRFGDRVVAVDLCIESAQTQVLLKTTYDETIKGLSPASLLRQDAYRQIFNDGRIRRIEFYGRVMEWTKRWTDTWRTIYHVNHYRWGFVPSAIRTLHSLRGALKRRTRSHSA